MTGHGSGSEKLRVTEILDYSLEKEAMGEDCLTLEMYLQAFMCTATVGELCVFIPEP